LPVTYTIDIRTLILVWALVSATKALILIFVRHTQRDYVPALNWAIGSSAMAVGLLLISFRDLLPTFVTIIIGNGLLLSGLMVTNFGVAEAAGRKPPWKIGWTIFVVTIAVLFWNSMVVSSTSVRILTFSLASTIYFVYVIYVCLSSSTGCRNSSFRVFAGVSIPLALITLWRGVASVYQGTSSLMTATSEQIVFITYYICYQIASTALLVLITNQQLQDQLEDLANHDSLTSVLNRRAFFDEVHREWSRVLRYNTPVSFLMIDIDNFKEINDRCGHACGDSILVEVSAALKKTLRIEDVICRYGGDEFVCMLPQVSEMQAQTSAERIRETVAALQVATKQSEIVLTVSIGVAERNQSATSVETVIAAADSALYRAKSSGRNRVVLRSLDSTDEPIY